MVYLSPSMTFFVKDKLGSHEFRGGADLYPRIANRTSSTLAPAEFYFRPPARPAARTCSSSATSFAGSTAERA